MASKRDIVIAVLVVGSILVFGFFIVLFIFGVVMEDEIKFTGLGKRIGIIDVHGEIYNSRDIVRQLKKYSDSGKIPAVVLHIDSPGGPVVPAMEIYDEILKVRDEGLIVVANFASVAASGGYLIACSCDTIVSNAGSITGSIGTVFSYPVADKLLDKIGLKYEVIKSGEYKDVGNFARSVTKKERRMLQSVINDSYRQFVEIVSESRGLPIEDVLKLAKGQIYTGAQAKELGLVDEIGNYYDAIDVAAEMAGIEGKPKTIKEIKRRRSFWDTLFEGIFLLKEMVESETVYPRLEYIMN